MKRILLCELNTRYSHSCLALLCLKHAAPEGLPIPLPAQPSNEALRGFFSDPESVQRYLPKCTGLAPRQIERRCRVYAFPRLFGCEGWVLFDRGQPGGESRVCMVAGI